MIFFVFGFEASLDLPRRLGQIVRKHGLDRLFGDYDRIRVVPDLRPVSGFVVDDFVDELHDFDWQERLSATTLQQNSNSFRNARPSQNRGSWLVPEDVLVYFLIVDLSQNDSEQSVVEDSLRTMVPQSVHDGIEEDFPHWQISFADQFLRRRKERC